MWLVYLSILIVLILYFWESIKMMINNVLTNKFENGLIWFLTLLVINIILIIFIGIFTYNKINEKGPDGKEGKQGFPGYEGEECKIKPECPINNIN